MEEANNKATVLNLTKNCGHVTGKVRRQECLHCPLLRSTCNFYDNNAFLTTWLILFEFQVSSQLYSNMRVKTLST